MYHRICVLDVVSKLQQNMPLPHHACTTYSDVAQGEHPQAILEDDAAKAEGISVRCVFVEDCVVQGDDYLVPYP